jgi:hypothetical protein
MLKWCFQISNGALLEEDLKFIIKSRGCFFRNILQASTFMPGPFWGPCREADVGVHLLLSINPIHDVEIAHFIVVGCSNPNYTIMGVNLE